MIYLIEDIIPAHFLTIVKDAPPPPSPLKAVPPPEPLAPAPTYTIEQLQTMALKHFSKTMLKDKLAAKGNYFTAWSNDMRDFIEAGGMTEQEFIDSILTLTANGYPSIWDYS